MFSIFSDESFVVEVVVEGDHFEECVSDVHICDIVLSGQPLVHRPVIIKHPCFVLEFTRQNPISFSQQLWSTNGEESSGLQNTLCDISEVCNVSRSQRFFLFC